ncbi:MAG: T9SS type A sorting domain-containing protein [candidate division Zixibacteria bacterium]|nr:T9SS type A sorting domain-containing protein [candidate division Zixibacteria bacterium]
MRKFYIVCISLLVYSGLLFAHSYYTGYSGAPSSNGTCSSSCHDLNNFSPTCDITGFPEVFAPGEQYTITVRHDGGLAISQFNCSIRIDSDSSIAGVITAGDNTETYTAANENNGIHWVSTDTDSGTFIWTAPDMWTRHVTLYWAGLQGTYVNGADQQIVLHSREVNSIDYIAKLPDEFALNQNYPNPFNSSTIISCEISKPGDVILEIANILGQRAYYISIPDAKPGRYSIDWNGIDNNGNELPSGLYFYQLRAPEGCLTRKMAILR